MMGTTPSALLRNSSTRGLRLLSLSFQAVSSLHENSSFLPSSQCDSGANGLGYQHPVPFNWCPNFRIPIKGPAKGHVLVKGPWAGLMVHLEKEFSLVRSLRIPGENNF
ncbi:hypothetical protein CK203_026476 [Vitis vinifera]|uniref:Uncharacterized protein n=1 Tax=Vitis vinifera TaxID=29760 RepID=A0A438IVK2_VITVI|nr:hypothetical protein CK203_026476 [Vitis vinifera]